MTSDTTDPTVLVPEGDGSTPLPERTPAPTFDGQPARTAGGMTMPSIGLGTFRLDSGEAAEMVGAALELGYRHIDTAQGYGNEDGVGRALAASPVDRSEVFVTTKVGNDNHEPRDLVASVEQSLEKLRMDFVDLLLIHWPVHYERMAATLEALAQVQAGGKARHLGVSNFTVTQLDQCQRFAPLQVLQVECHPFFQQAELRRWCHDHDWLFTAYSPVAQGAVLDDDVLAAIAGELSDGERSVNPAQVALAYLATLDGVVTIPRTSDADHLAANWASRELTLSDEQVQRIAALDQGRRVVDPDFAPWR